MSEKPRGERRKKALSKENREFVRMLVGEISAETARTLGIQDMKAHHNHHIALDSLLPWLDSKKQREEKWSRLIEKVTTDVFTSTVKWVLLGAALAMILGASGVFDALVRAILLRGASAP